MTLPPTPSPNTGKNPDELRLRRTEVHTQIWAGIAQVVLSVATVAAVLIALWVARQGQESLKSATQNNLQQAQDNQFSTSLTSLGSTDVTERIAGLSLLELDAADRLTAASVAAFGKPSAYDYYTTALQIFSGYLHSHGVGSMSTAGAGGDTQPFGPGYGAPPPGAFSIDIQYAADELAKMLGLKDQVRAVSTVVPAFDLANDELYDVNFKGMDLSWVHAYMVGIDLRGAVLEKVHLSSLDDVESSHLQCADLRHADLQGADLAGANLRGADLYHANLRGANLTGADLQDAYVRGADFSGAQHGQATLTSMYGTAKGLPPGVVTLPGQPRILPSCLASPSYGDMPMPMPNPMPTSSPSATPSPSAGRKK
jgi:Pentapeptide repeats (8 copies)